MDAALVCDLFKQAMCLRGYPSDLLFHPDRGSQYTSADFVQYFQAVQTAPMLGAQKKRFCCNRAV